MILKLLLEILMFIVKFIIGLIASITPEFTPQATISQLLPELIGMFTQAKNFCYFIIGDAFYIIVDFIVGFLTFKLVIFPVALLIRKNLTKTE